MISTKPNEVVLLNVLCPIHQSIAKEGHEIRTQFIELK